MPSPIAPPAFRRILFRFLSLAVLASVLGPVQAETWTDLRGTRSIEARMIGMWNDSVVLEMDGSRRVAVPMNALRSDSRIQAQNLWEEIKRTRQSRIDELQGLAVAAAAPAPTPIPKPKPAPAYQKPVANAKVSDFLQHLDDQIAAGHPVVIYDSLPPSYRSDINEVVQMATTKINPATWHAMITSLHQIGEQLVTRQNWFFSSPRINALPADDYDTLHENLLLLGGILRDGLQPDAVNLAKIQSMDFGQWLADRDQAVAPYFAQLIGDRRFNVLSETPAGAQVNISVGGSEAMVNLVPVEGFWVPASLAASWNDRIAAMKNQIQQTPQGTYLAAELSLVAALQPMLMPLASASDQGDYHEALEAVMPGVQSAMMAVAATTGMNMNIASNDRRGQRPGMYGEDYGDMMDDEMMMEEEMLDDGMMMEDMGEYGPGSGPPAGSGRPSGMSGPPSGGSGPPSGFGSGPPSGGSGPPSGFGSGPPSGSSQRPR